MGNNISVDQILNKFSEKDQKLLSWIKNEDNFIYENIIDDCYINVRYNQFQITIEEFKTIKRIKCNIHLFGVINGELNKIKYYKLEN